MLRHTGMFYLGQRFDSFDLDNLSELLGFISTAIEVSFLLGHCSAFLIPLMKLSVGFLFHVTYCFVIMKLVFFPWHALSEVITMLSHLTEFVTTAVCSIHLLKLAEFLVSFELTCN
jgi:hypothetical protein